MCKHVCIWVLIVCYNVLAINTQAQTPTPALIGYFHNWQDANAPYIQLDQIDNRYNIIDVAFAIPKTGTDYQMEFVPDQVSKSVFISQIQTLQSQGKIVLISLGGATAPISLDNTMERDSFIASVTSIIETYGFNGLDIDFEGSSLSVSGGTISAPVDAPIVNLIFAVKQIMATYYSMHNKHLVLTMAPETAFVQGGQSAYGGIWGAYLPVIHALRDSLDILHVQLYNSGTMYGVDGNIYAQGTADFIIAMCDAVIKGFNTNGGFFTGLPSHKIAVGLPACILAAGGGFVNKDTIKAAVNYLLGVGTKPGFYTLTNAGGYPSFRGMMTWSINWDAVASCGSVYEYASNYEVIFGVPNYLGHHNTLYQKVSMFPNPVSDILHLNFTQSNNSPVGFKIYNAVGQIIYSGKLSGTANEIKISGLPSGIYCIQSGPYKQMFVKQ